ncbi:hypothetical protein Ancab_011518, partial [Ancistrocladus abbreviatus]
LFKNWTFLAKQETEQKEAKLKNLFLLRTLTKSLRMAEETLASMPPSTKLPPFLCQTCWRDVSKLCFGGFSACSEEWLPYTSHRKGVEVDDASDSSIFSIVINPSN